MQTTMPRHYFTGAWRHVMPHRRMISNLDQIAKLACDYDLIGLQEADAGSIRSRGINQIDYIAEKAGFNQSDFRINRNIAGVARHSLGYLSQYCVVRSYSLGLPGLPGRGALAVELAGEQPLLFVNTHLALGQRARRRQLAAIAGLISEYTHVILVGDANTSAPALLRNSALSETDLKTLEPVPCSYPSWASTQSLDHVLVSESLQLEAIESIDLCLSDHLPVAAQITVPFRLKLAG